MNILSVLYVYLFNPVHFEEEKCKYFFVKSNRIDTNMRLSYDLYLPLFIVQFKGQTNYLREFTR